MKNLIILLTTLLLVSCLENSPNFLEPQPTDTKDLKSFPKKLRGTFIMNENESLSISKYHIEQYGQEDFEMSIAEIDTTPELTIKNNKLIDTKAGDEIAIEIRNDSVFGTIFWTDTSFYISEKHLLRKVNKDYLLNELSKDSVWKVVRLRYVDKAAIEFATIHKKKELEELQKITKLYNVKLENDTVKDYSLSPSKEEFILMLANENLFTDKETFKKE